MTADSTTQKHIHILIVGAGLTGLVLAQGINKFNASPTAANYPARYTYSIFERDPAPLSRGGGYSLTFHWGLPFLENALPPEILKGINDCLCNPHAAETGQRGRFQYLSMRTAKPKISVAAMQQLRIARVSREKLMSLLLRGVDVEYSRQLTGIDWPDNDTVQAHFSDGSSAVGNLLIGADGGNSVVRRLLCPGPAGESVVLPVRQLALRASYPMNKCAEFQKIDPNVIMGADPEKNTFFWFSFINIPRPGSDVTSADCYITMSYPCLDAQGNKLDENAAPLVPATSQERLALMKRLVEGWAEPMRSIIADLPDDTYVREISILEWLPEKGAWDTHGGRVTIAGDAAHPMSSFRGEAANHGVVDAGTLLNLLLGKKDAAESTPNGTPNGSLNGSLNGEAKPRGEINLKNIIDAYENEMVERSRPGVLRSTQACIDANHWESVGENSFFATVRKIDA